MPEKSSRITSSNQKFVACVVAAGTFGLCDSLSRLYSDPPSSRWLVLAALTVFSGVFTIKVPSVPVTISVSETFVFTTVLLFGTPAATVTVALDALIMSSWRHRREPLKVLFNATEPALSIWLASSLFFLIVGRPLTQQPRDVSTLLVPILVLSLSYFLLNSWLTAIAVGLETRVGVIGLWKNHFRWLSLNYLVGASVAALIVRNSTEVQISTLGVIVPVLVVSYLTLKSSMGRVEDANKHLEQVNRMYMSTIETLAMAVDAKDQITHGHIRRVQSYAVGLSRALEMDDVQLLKAIEAAGLLHDMGKLGIPEHILNKPGKLTPAEFEVMKQHAGMGADMLAAIDFPYPVVPIVRHHHENWDGTGYPDGLSGTSIPIGARVLSVVDCFDALTSDRPYRPKLSETAAFDILRERRGSMYDPLIVDTFIEVYQQLSSELASAQPNVGGIATQDSPSLLSIDSLAEFSGKEGPHVRFPTDAETENVAHNTVQFLSSNIENVFAVVYRFNESLDCLEVLAAPENAPRILRDLRIPLGQRLSGWVGANRQTIVNSRASLDFGTLHLSFVLNSAISTPLTSGEQLLGVLSVYRLSNEDFSLEDKGLIESMARAVAMKLGNLKDGRVLPTI